jgi:hypothetical protein
MKTFVNFTCCFFLLVCAKNVLAQDKTGERSSTSKGKILVGSSSGFSVAQASIDGVSEKLTNINLDVSTGYFVADRFVIGVQGGYQYTKFASDKSTAGSYGLFGRYYTQSNFFVGTGYRVSKSGKSKSVGTIPVELGYAYFLSPSVAIEPAVNLGIPGHNNDAFIYAFTLGFSLYLH